MSEPGSNNLILLIWISLVFAGLIVLGSLVVMVLLLTAYAPTGIPALPAA